MREARARWFGAVMAIAWGAAASGCGGGGSGFNYRHPPASTSRTADVLDVASAHRTIIVIGQFANPPRAAVNWRDIGSGMSETLARTLHNRGDYDVRMGERGWNRASDLGAIRKAHPDATMFVTGSVTDFHQTGELPKQLARQGLFSRRSEAVVAVQLSVVDLRSGTIVVSDHVAGTSKAGDIAARQLYKDISFGSYLFWNTPLGEASDQALARVMECIERAVPQVEPEAVAKARAGGAVATAGVEPIMPAPRIIALTGFRRVSIEGGRDRGLKLDNELFVVRDAGEGAVESLIIDPVTAMPLRARIDSIGESTATAWLLGEPASKTELIGAVLRLEAPPQAAREAAPETAPAHGLTAVDAEDDAPD